jgi:ATPase family associated with various cellular activities (AAA)
LCKALAQKLAIRMGRRYKRTILLEIQSHSLFSKWFSTSGKLVHRVFELVRDMVQDDPDCLVCVLIDEIESLASNRSAMSAGGNGSSNEPTDALRAVNSLLTSLDRLRNYSNCLILATTNLTGAVDAAFLDRADMKVFIDLPGRHARYEILRSCLKELLRCDIIKTPPAAAAAADTRDEVLLLPYDTIIAEQQALSTVDNNNVTPSKALLTLATKATGLSGRSLRRLPLQAHAHLRAGSDFNMIHFIETMLQVVEKDAAQSDAARVVATAACGSTTAEEAATAVGRGIGETSMTSPKKPRGRPPGTSTQGHLVNLFIRRGGRPERAVTTKADYSSFPNHATRAELPRAGDGAQTSAFSLPAVKRGPGRPRKDPLKRGPGRPGKDPVADEEEGEGVQQGEILRKLGRPPKHAPSITTVVRKGPGRPRKHAIVDGEELGSVKKSRPPKNDDEPLSEARRLEQETHQLGQQEDTTTTTPLEPTDDAHNNDGLDSITLPSEPPKRKRGRPRKTPIEATAPLQPHFDLVDNESEVPPPQQKLKPGRPKGSGSASKPTALQHDSDDSAHDI